MKRRGANKRAVGTLLGIGVVHREEGAVVVGPANYELVIWEQAGVRSIAGKVTLLDYLPPLPLALLDVPLVLTIQDGRRAPFRFRSTDGAATFFGEITSITERP